MQTDMIDVWQVNERDLVTLGGDVAFTVASVEDNDDSFSLALTNDDGETEVFEFRWDEPIELVVSLDDDDDETVDSVL